MDKKQIHIVDGKREFFLPLDDILFVRADHNYCEVYLKDTTYPDIRILLGKLWKLIETEGKGYPHHLERVGRSTIINLDLLMAADPKKKTITLHTDQKDIVIPVAGVAVKELLKHLKNEKRREVLSAFAFKHKLTVPVHELNDEHQFEVGEEYVDLGLTSGTLWATRNVGAQNDTVTEYYGWGQLNLSDSYDDDGYNAPSRNMNDWDKLPLDYDVAHQDWGGGWRMPTEEDFQELANECILIFCQTKNGNYGVLATGPNGNRIFLPACGVKDGIKKENENGCVYWTSSKRGLKQQSTAAHIIEYDEEKSLAGLLTYTEDWYTGLSIRPVLSKPTTPEAPKMKTQLVINDINMLIGSAKFEKCTLLHGWRYAELNLPISPKEAMDFIKRFCAKYSPDIIIGKGSGCFYVHQLIGYKRICVNPLFHPSELFPVGKHDYEISLYKESEFEVTPAIHQQFTAMEEHQFDNADDGNCWCMYYDDNDYDVREFFEHYSNGYELPELKDDKRWESTVLVPLIKEITK